ncbi:hypothetical protein [Sulfuriroseicoccus oceanibius]|uniref:Uncharacterized protein n=1 Tax=Sulfuriroseicoccus oceanibius TaxID=2707525 RepID=A0A6B3L8P3_9BACT|nr:hypothetical protein [Sulfuriroseicoccus oceanibius]QQL44644.1 hypothetical protein G3M56_012250 [Sulfuriroseicoccus oceanibius]
MIARFFSLDAALRYADACRERGDDVVVLDESVSTLRGGVSLVDRVDLEGGEALSFELGARSSWLRRLQFCWGVARAAVTGLLVLAIAVLAAWLFLVVMALRHDPLVGALLLVGLVLCGIVLAVAGWLGWRLGRGQSGVAMSVFVTLCMALPVVGTANYVLAEERTYAVLRIT